MERFISLLLFVLLSIIPSSFPHSTDLTYFPLREVISLDSTETPVYAKLYQESKYAAGVSARVHFFQHNAFDRGIFVPSLKHRA